MHYLKWEATLCFQKPTPIAPLQFTHTVSLERQYDILMTIKLTEEQELENFKKNQDATYMYHKESTPLYFKQEVNITANPGKSAVKWKSETLE